MAANEASYPETKGLSLDQDVGEDRAALLASKAYAVVTRDDPYHYFEVEEDFI